MSAVTVVGAGVAGLTLAYQLARRGWDVTVLEAHHEVGGLGRSWHYGDFHFDVGPHRFHTENPRVAAFVSEVLGAAAIEIPRRSGVRMFGRFHEWPLRPGILLAMPVSTMARAAIDLLRRERLPGDSFEADIVNKYGRTLYEVFFEPYTEKFLFCSPAALHRDWGRAGVNRAVIDKRAHSDGLWSLLRNTLLPAPVDTTFIYAPHGVGEFAERLAAGIRAAGGRVLLNRRVDGIERRGGRITALRAGHDTFAVEHLVWTAPITLANQLLGVDDVRLDYLSTIFYNLEIDAPAKLDFQWTYYGGDEVFSRISTPTAFAPTMAPAGRSGLCVEVTCREGDERWQAPERLTAAVIADLVRTQTIDAASQVTAVHIERVPFTYPIYRLEYFSELTRNLRELGRYSNLLLAGRCGRFWYNNMDHSIGQALTMADRILKGQILAQIDTADREFWVDQPAAGTETAAGASLAPAPTPTPPAPSVPPPSPVLAPAAARASSAETPVTGWQPPAWTLWGVGAAIAVVLFALSWLIGHGPMGPAYATGYGLALAPGLPLGWWLFGRRHAAGWIAGGLIGYALTAWVIWGATAAGLVHPRDRVVAWLALIGLTWGSGLLGRAPLIALPTWTRKDSLALLLTLAMVPALVGTAFVKVGASDAAGARHYRAYFTADVLWHSALTTEISRFSWPLRNPYTADRELHYYWTYFLVPPAIASTAPGIFGDEPLPWLLITATGAGLLFMGVLFLFAWCALPRAALTAVSVSVVFLAASAEGAYILQRLWRTGGPLDALRNYNIDAVTRVVFDGLTVDDLPRSLWYTPQHAAACALGLVALMAAAHARPRMPVAGAALAGLSLAAAVTFSPLIGGMFAAIYGASVLVAALRAGWRQVPATLVPHATALAAAVAAAVVISASGMVEGAGNALHIGFVGYARRHPVGTLLLAVGPALLPGLIGLWPRRFPTALIPAAVGLLAGIALFYLGSLPYRDPIWVGWRAGQIMLVVLPPLVARALANGLLRSRPLTMAATAVVFAVGLPTTIIDAYNTQDTDNHRMGAGFHWTLTLTPAQQEAFSWIRSHTPRNAIVQCEPIARGADTWTMIPTFAQRRMWAGLPISLLADGEYTRRARRIRDAYASADAEHAWRIFREAHVRYVYLDRVERSAFPPEASAKFDQAPRRFRNVFRKDDVTIYEVD
jgi:protoporphyrinogen oxidase